MTPRKDVLNGSNTTDREKLLHIVLSELAINGSLIEPPKSDRIGGHLAYYKNPEIGDLVLGTTGREIGWLLEINRDDFNDPVYTIKILGTENIITWGNESFRPILGIPKSRLLQGEERLFSDLVHQTIQEHETGYLHSYNRVEFSQESATVWVWVKFVHYEYSINVPNYKQYLREDSEDLAEYLLSQGWGKR